MLGVCILFLIDLYPPGCGALFLRRGAVPACKKQTAAPAPPRLFLPQAAPRLRSPPPFWMFPRPCGPAPIRGLWASDCSLIWRLGRSFQADALRLLRSLHQGGAVCGTFPPEGGMPRSGRGDSAKRAVGGFRSKIKRAHSPTGGIMARTAGKVKADPLLLRLADFCGAGRRPLAKTGALRQTRLAVSSAGRASACLPLALSESCGTIVYTPE